jgi:hypothetical protein
MPEAPQPGPDAMEQNHDAEVIHFPLDEVRREELRLEATQQAHQENLARSVVEHDPLMKTIREELIAEKQQKIEQMRSQVQKPIESDEAKEKEAA